MLETKSRIIIASIPSALIFLKNVEFGIFGAIFAFILFFIVVYFLTFVWDMITHKESEETVLDEETQDSLTIFEWYDDDMNRFKKKPVSVVLAEARSGTKGKFRVDE